MSKDSGELPVVGYGVELPSGKLSRFRAGLDDARRHVEWWNNNHPNPQLAKIMRLCDHATATAIIEGLRADALRYRWLRNVAEASDWEYIGYQTPEASDSEIDMRMASQGRGREGGG